MKPPFCDFFRDHRCDAAAPHAHSLVLWSGEGAFKHQLGWTCLIHSSKATEPCLVCLLTSPVLGRQSGRRPTLQGRRQTEQTRPACPLRDRWPDQACYYVSSFLAMHICSPSVCACMEEGSVCCHSRGNEFSSCE